MARKFALIFVLSLAWMAAPAAIAAGGGAEPVGSLVGSRDAMLDGQRPLPHTVLLSGDKLQVNDGLALVTLGRGNRMLLGAKSEAIFLLEAKALTVLMVHGSLSIYHPAGGSGPRIRVGDVMVAAPAGRLTVGEIALAGGALVVTAKDGSLEIEKNGAISEVAKGETLTLVTSALGLPGEPHLKRAVNHRSPYIYSSAPVAEGDSAAAAEIALDHRHHRHVSPIHPGPRR